MLLIYFIQQNRRSWHEDSGRLTQSQFTLGAGSGESGGNESDNSTEESLANRSETLKRASGIHPKPKDEVALRKSHRDLSAHRSSIAGSVIHSSCISFIEYLVAS